MSFQQKIRKLDVFKKPPRDLTQASNRGGLISIFAAISITAFITIQVYNYVNPQYQSMVMPLRRNLRKKMIVNIDIVFPKFPCQLISIEMQDQIFDRNSNIDTVKKQRLDQNGNSLGQVRGDQKLGDQDQYERTKMAIQNHHGCRMKGNFQVNEVPGIFRFSPFGNIQILGLIMAEGVAKNIDISHQIKQLSFGQANENIQVLSKHPNALIESLSNTSQTFNNQTSVYFHYHLDIVPTSYRDGDIIDTYQYVWKTNMVEEYNLPVLYFQYKVGGVALEIHRDRGVLSKFLIKLCAVVGGTFTIAAFLNNLLQYLVDDRHKGYNLVL